jgi:hypothetical protein
MTEQRFCPKCGSDNVKINMSAINSSFGIYSDWICNDCGFSLKEFPLREIIIKTRRIK